MISLFSLTPLRHLPKPQGTAAKLIGLALISLLASAARAQSGGAELTEATQRWLDKAVANLATGTTVPLRLEVLVGELDSRLQLARCNRLEPYLPPGSRLWGKTRLGLRCAEGPVKWNVFLPLTVRAWGPAWVIKGQVASGATLSREDAMEAEVDWAEETSPVVGNPERWIGHIATRSLPAGLALREVMLKPAQAFQAGSQVRVVAQGSGFQIASDGQALTAGVLGQMARVRMDNGRVATGRVIDNRTIRLDI